MFLLENVGKVAFCLWAALELIDVAGSVAELDVRHFGHGWLVWIGTAELGVGARPAAPAVGGYGRLPGLAARLAFCREVKEEVSNGPDERFFPLHPCGASSPPNTEMLSQCVVTEEPKRGRSFDFGKTHHLQPVHGIGSLQHKLLNPPL